VGIAVSLEAARFLVILGSLAVAPVFGVAGWYLGLFVNVCCVLYGIAAISVLGLWKQERVLRVKASWRALLWMLPLLLEGTLRFAFGTVSVPPPGLALWIVTLALAALNEELVNRAAIVGTLRRALRPVTVATISATLFGFAHLSLFITTPTRDPVDILLNVVASACFGFALAAYQVLYRWILPLVVAHGFANASVILGGGELSTLGEGLISVAYVAFGVLLFAFGRPHHKASHGVRQLDLIPASSGQLLKTDEADVSGRG